MSLDMPTGFMTGPWKTSIAGKVALELALDGGITVFPNDEDDREPQELTIHVLSNEGFQIREEMQRRPAMTEAEKLAKRANRVVCYALLPAEMMNLRAAAYEARSAYFRNAVTTHFLKKGAANVGFCQSRNNEGRNTNRVCVFVEFPNGLTCDNPDAKSKEFAASALLGAKYFDIKCAMPAKIQFAGCQKFGLRPCCFRTKCVQGIGPWGAISCEAGNFYKGAAMAR